MHLRNVSGRSHLNGVQVSVTWSVLVVLSVVGLRQQPLHSLKLQKLVWWRAQLLWLACELEPDRRK